MLKPGPFFFALLICLNLLLGSEAWALEWWATTPEEVMQAPCKTLRPPTFEEIENGLLGKGALTSAKVNGIQFKSEKSDLIQLFKDLHTLDSSLRDKPELQFSVSCDKVVCAMKSIYGEKEGLQLLYLMKVFGFNGSHLRTKFASAWRSDELNEILQALSDYPLSLYPVAYNKRLVHFTRGMGYGDLIIANATIEIFDPWNEMSFPERQQTFLHELGHTLSYKNKLDVSAEWLRIAGWKESVVTKNGVPYKTYKLIDPTKSVSEYGQDSPSEDFAETVVAYRFNGAKLLQNQPDKYLFIKRYVFLEKEYLSHNQCFSH